MQHWAHSCDSINHGSDAWQCGMALRDLVDFVEWFDKVEIVGIAALALHPAAVVAVVLQRHCGMCRCCRMVVEYQLAALPAAQSCRAAWRSREDVVRIHWTNQQRRSRPGRWATTTTKLCWRTIHAAVCNINNCSSICSSSGCNRCSISSSSSSSSSGHLDNVTQIYILLQWQP